MNQNELINRINQLPKGYISIKNIKGKNYHYLQWKENGKVRSKYIKSSELDSYVVMINERKSLEVELEIISKTADLSHICEYAKKASLSSHHFTIGSQDYEEIISQKGFYVDKTDFISKWWNSGDKVTLITRPRRFGKTLNMSMINCFFSTGYRNRSDLFEGMKISSDTTMFELQGVFPVIFLSFGNVKGSSASMLLDRIRDQLALTLSRFDTLIKTQEISSNACSYYWECRESSSISDMISALSILFELLYEIYNKKVIVLLDEYDTPMIEAWSLGKGHEECSTVLRSLFNTLFKTNPFLERGLLTGITRIGKESFFSDLNNIRVYGITSGLYEDSFGFTKTEVINALNEQGLDTLDDVRAWYDGFTFGSVHNIYNPWSIVNYLSDRELKPYWVNTSSNKLISDIMRSGSVELKYAIEDLLSGKSISVRLNENMVFEDLFLRDDALWNLLFCSGYLKSTRHHDGIYELVPTNKEVHIMLNDLIHRWFDGTGSYNTFIKALLDNNAEYLNKSLNAITSSMFSFYDTSSSQNEPERFYHGFVLGLIVDLKDDYIITSNRESGLGRYDVIIEPRRNSSSHAVIMEFKVKSSSEKTLKDTSKRALEQISNKKYFTDLVARGYDRDNIYSYGIAFDGKQVFVLSECE